MNFQNNARTLAMAGVLAAVVSGMAVTARFASAEPVQQTGPNGAQCRIKNLDTDFSSTDNNYQTNDALDSFGGSIEGIRITPAGCGLSIQNPPQPPTTPTPTPAPVRHAPVTLPIGKLW